MSDEELDTSLNVSYEELNIPENDKISFSNLKRDSRLLQNDDSLNFKVITSPDYFKLTVEEFNNNLNDDASDGELIARSFETHFDDIFEGISYFISSERGKISSEKEALKEEVGKFVEFCMAEREKMGKMREKLRRSEAVAEKFREGGEVVEVEVNGTTFMTTRNTLCKYKTSKLAVAVNDFIDKSKEKKLKKKR